MPKQEARRILIPYTREVNVLLPGIVVASMILAGLIVAAATACIQTST